MEETDSASQNPAPAGPDGNNAGGGRRVKRRLMYSLVGLYLLSLGAAAALLLRAPSSGPGGKDAGDGARRLLSLADKDAVGWVSIRGPIYSSEGGRSWEKGADQWARKIRSLAETKGIKAIVLDINSPGGSVGAVQELHSQILRVRKEKGIPVVALFGDVAASGGYYIAAACDKIVAHPGTLTGSIGVIFSVSNLEGLFGKVGYRVEPIKSGKHKDIGSPARPMTPEERALLQRLIDDAFSQFVAAVAEGRKLPEADVRVLADGRIYSGRQALESKLVDQLGDSIDALELAGKLGGIQGRPKVRKDAERFSDIFELLETRAAGFLGVKTLAEGLGLRERYGLEYRWPGW